MAEDSKYITVEQGLITAEAKTQTAVSVGSGPIDAGRLVALNQAGKIDPSLIDQQSSVPQHAHTEADITDLDKYTTSEVDALLLPKLEAGYSATITGDWNFTGSLTLSGNTIWHSGNFDPSTKSNIGHTHPWNEITGTPTTLAGYGITDAASLNHNHDSIYSQLGHTHTWGEITGTPTTLAGYGITDAALANHNHDTVYSQLGHGHTWAEISSTPTTLSGYGITDAAPLNHNHDSVYSQLGHNHVANDITDFTASVEDVTGAMVSGNSESGVSVTYNSTTRKLDFSIPDTWHTHRPAQYGYYKSVNATNGMTMYANYGHRVDVSGGPMTLTLPSAGYGTTVAIYCIGGDFTVNNLTILRNGSVTIMGVADDLLVDIKNAAFVLYCHNATDWRLI